MIPLQGVILFLAPLDDHAEVARGWSVQRADAWAKRQGWALVGEYP
jgi:hypothetical protein